MVFQVGSRGQCPHCLTTVKFEESQYLSNRGGFVMMETNRKIVADSENKILSIYFATCPSCMKAVVSAELFREDSNNFEHVMWPLQYHRPIPDEVPKNIANDYSEAAAILHTSPKASAALSRRCLQAILVDKGNVTKGNLAQQIDEVMPHLPAYIADSIDAIRNIGNFAAHPQKSQSSGEIVDVEPGEAEWNLDVLDMLFDHYYVRPEMAKRKRATLDSKLADSGKPNMK